MSLGKLIKYLIILGVIGAGVYFVKDPVMDFWAGVTSSRTGRNPESTAGQFGIAVDQSAAGFTGQTQVGALQRAKTKITSADLSTIRNAIEMYRIDHNGQIPNDLKELVKSGALGGNQSLKDPWGTEYDSQRIGNQFIIISAGLDKVKGTADDQSIDLTAPEEKE